MTPSPAVSCSAEPLWLGLTLTPGLGLRGTARLLQRFASIEHIYAASLTELESCEIAAEAAQSIHSGKSAELGANESKRARELGAMIISRGDRNYPELLREIHDPPTVLYVRGRADALDTFGVAVVGTRHPTLYGKLMAERLGRDLANWGVTVFSGMARGIDSTGQRACIEAGGTTVAVLGNGVDVVYPPENRKLAESILKSDGALVSEFPLGAVPATQNFPLRNRVISGLSLGVLVVEGGEFSGSRITARMALEQNRDVYALPGMATQKMAWLPNMLIKQGAKLVTEVADIINELPSAVRARLTPPEPPPSLIAAPGSENGPDSGSGAAGTSTGASNGASGLILHSLQVDEASHVDEIINRLENSLTAPEILTILFELEMAGKIRQLPGKKYLRVS